MADRIDIDALRRDPAYQRLWVTDRNKAHAIIAQAEAVNDGTMAMPAMGPTRTLEIPSIYTRPPQGGKPTIAQTTSGARTSGGVTTLPKALPAAEQATVASLKSIMNQLANLKGNMQKVGTDGWDREFFDRWWTYGNRRYLHRSSGDTKIDDLTDQLIAIEAQAQAALAHSSGTRAYSFVQNSSGHIPHGAGDYDYNMGAINFLADPNGPYRSYLRSVGQDNPELYESQFGKGKSTEPPPATGDDPVAAALRKHGLGE